MSEVRIRRMRPADVARVADIHLASFPGFFLTFLGRRFLFLLYENLVNGERTVSLVAEGDGGVSGFVAGVENQAGFYRAMIRRRILAFAFASGAAAVRRPAIIPRLFRALRSTREARTLSAPAVLMSIAVDPAAGGKGIGRSLVLAFLEEMRARGHRRVCLTTDADGNDRTNLFYRQLGFKKERTYVTPEGRRMNEYARSLEEGEECP